MDVRVGLWRKLSAKELMLLNCGVGEDCWESFGLQEIQPVHPKGDQSWVFTGRTDVEAETPTLATWCEELTHLKRPWCWERLRARGEGDDIGLDSWMASLTRWTWVWVNSGSWWWTEAWHAAINGVAKSRTRLNEWTELTDVEIYSFHTPHIENVLSQKDVDFCHISTNDFYVSFCDNHMIFIFHSINVMYHIDLYMVYHSCILGINPTLSWCVIFSMFCWI